ncbi:MAG: hypothetical protein ACI8P9_005122 [Parasphingorhabdus sp.]|jgi:hypothetical protein
MHDNQSAPMMQRPEGKEVMGAAMTTPNPLEIAAMADLDIDKINELAECLFVLNNRHYGPIAGAYMVVCTSPGKQWCVAQLNADRAKPMILFEDKVYPSPELAQEEALRIKAERGESAPCRCT